MKSKLIFTALPLNVYHSLVVQVSDSSIHRINHCPADKYWENQLHYPVDGDFSSEEYYPPLEQLGLAVYNKHYSPFWEFFSVIVYLHVWFYTFQSIYILKTFL